MYFPPVNVPQSVLDEIWQANEEGLIPYTAVLDGKSLILNPADDEDRFVIRTAVLQRIAHIYLALCGNRYGRDRGSSDDRYRTTDERKEKSTRFIEYVMKSKSLKSGAAELYAELEAILKAVGYEGV